MKNPRRLPTGFTIVELLMFMGLVTVLLGILTSIFLTAIDVQLSSQSASVVEQDGRYLLSRFAYDIHRATSVSAPALGETANQLSLVIDGDTFTYTVSGGKLQLTTGAGTAALSGLETTVSGFTVTRIGNAGGKHTLNISFTTTGTGTSTQPAETRSYQVGIGLR